MTQLTKIFSYLLKNPAAKAKEIAEKLDLNYNSVRGRLSELKKQSAVINENSKWITIADKIPPKVKVVINKMKKYILNTVVYCSSKPKTLKAYTFSDENFSKAEIRDLMIEMAIKIQDETSDKCSDIAYDSGLDIQEVKSMPFTYPEIKTGNLITLSQRDLEYGNW